MNVVPAIARAGAIDRHLSDIGQRIARAGLNFRGVAHVHHPAPTLALALIVLAVCGVVLIVPGVWCFKRRHHLRSSLRGSLRGLVSPKVWKERRKWSRSVGKAEINGCPAPKPIGGWPTCSGVTLVIRFDGGMNLALIEKKRAEVASEMRCRDVQFEPIAHNQGRGYVRIIRKDPWARSEPWPLLAADSKPDFLRGIPVAVDMDGKTVTVNLEGRNMLVGGIPNSGKSWFLHLLIATALLTTRVKVHVHTLDGKMGVELDCWERFCADFATDDEPELAMKIIKRAQADVNRIFSELRAEGKRKIDWAKAREIHLLVIDEYTAFLPIPGFEAALNELVRRGRAAGWVVVLATQRPSAQVIKTDLRELLAYRVALQCTDQASSTMILGSGYSDFDASKFSRKNPGEMWFLYEGAQPVHCRAYGLPDKALTHLAARVQALRSTGTRSVPNHQQTKGEVRPESHGDTPPGSPKPDPRTSNLVLVPSSPTPVRPLSPELAGTLRSVAKLGPKVPGPKLQEALGLTPPRQSEHCNKLYQRGLISRVRQPSQGGSGRGGSLPWLWTITDIGTKALESRKERAEPPKEAGAQ